MDINDTQRLDFIINHSVEWQGFTGHKEQWGFFELSIWNKGEVMIFEANNKRGCIDKAIKENNWK